MVIPAALRDLQSNRILQHRGKVCRSRSRRGRGMTLPKCIENYSSTEKLQVRGLDFAVCAFPIGLNKMAAPALIERRRLVDASAGPFPPKPPLLEHFRAWTTAFGFNEQKPLAIFVRSSSIDVSQPGTGARFFDDPGGTGEQDVAHSPPPIEN
jgi:hypothetical protein